MEKDTYKKGNLFVSAVLLLLAIAFVAFVYLYWNKQNSQPRILRTRQEVEQAKNKIEVTPSPQLLKTRKEIEAAREKIEEAPLELSDSISSLSGLLREIYGGKVEFKVQDGSYMTGVLSYSNLVNFPYDRPNSSSVLDRRAWVTITVYKYVPGEIANFAYEGSRWKVRMDSWVNFLSSIELGQTQAKRVTYWGEGDKLSPISVMTFGGRKYAVYDGGFRPSGSSFRDFATYDRANSQIVIIEAGASFVNGIRYLGSDSALYEWPSYHQKFLDQVENIISSI